MFYMALDGVGNIKADVSRDYLRSIHGYSPELGNFKMTFPKKSYKKSHYNYLVSHVSSLDKIKDVCMTCAD